MQRRIAALIMILVVVLSIATLILARTLSTESPEGCPIEELKELVHMMAMDESWKTAHDRDGLPTEERHLLLFNFWRLIQEAARIMYSERGHFPDGIIRGIGGAATSFDGRYSITFISEEYLEFIDLITHFTGIERERINAGVGGRHVCIHLGICEC